MRGYLALFLSPGLSSSFRLAPAAGRAYSQSFLRMFRNPFNSPSLIPKVLEDPKWPSEWPYSPSDFQRQDPTPDSDFYSQPRFVHHIDDGARAALTNFYDKNFKPGDDVLDICSSWVSHYPPSWVSGKASAGGSATGLGMNEQELSYSTELDTYVVHDLNVDAKLPFPDESFDAVTCVVSVDYLVRPREVFAEIARVLRPGGRCYISMSNRCFPTKAFRIWLNTSDLEHVFIVGSFFHFTEGAFEPPKAHDVSPNPGISDPMFIVEGVKKA